MKTIMFFLVSVCVTNILLAQVPTQAEMDRLMKEAKETLKNIDPETKKMMDSMGIKMPQAKGAPKIGDKKLANTYEEMTRVIPLRDAARIAIVPNLVMTDAAILPFITKTHSAVSRLLPAEIKDESDQIYQLIKTSNSNPVAIANAASGLWISGNYKQALYLMGKAALENSAHADNLNNYASFLTMTGAEQAALPILLNLNKKFPKNSTVLNNIGQAWFGLGEFDKASKYLDSTILMYAMHSQANYTKCIILESKGDKSKAVEVMKKSIKNSYSNEKNSKLRDQGYEINEKDLSWNFRIPADALGLERFFLPGFPVNTAQSHQLEFEWKAFRNACTEQMQELRQKNVKLEEEATRQTLRVQQDLLNAVRTGQRIASVPLVPFYHSKAVKKLIYLVDDKDGSIHNKKMRLFNEGQAVNKKVILLKEQRLAELNKLSKEYYTTTITGDGGISEEEYCQKETAILDKYLPQINKLYEDIQKESLELARKTINNNAYFNLFVLDPLRFEIHKNEAKAGWLHALSTSKVEFSECNKWKSKKTPPETYEKKLPDFDDLHCEYNTKLNFFIGSYEMNCSRMTTKFEKGPLKLELKENLNTGEIIRGTVEIGVSKGFGVEKGPVKAEVEIGAGVQIEIEKSGISDVIVKAGAEVKAGSNVINGGPEGDKTILPPGVGDKSITLAGVEVRYGWNSGGAVEGKGILKGMKY